MTRDYNRYTAAPFVSQYSHGMSHHVTWIRSRDTILKRGGGAGRQNTSKGDTRARGENDKNIIASAIHTQGL